MTRATAAPAGADPELPLADIGPLHLITDHQPPPADEPAPGASTDGAGSLSEWLA